MKRIIVIGGAGFLGQSLVPMLLSEGGYTVLVVDLTEPENSGDGFVRRDIREGFDFIFKPEDIVVHLAANQYHNKIPRNNREAYFSDTNTRGTQNILECMQRCGTRNIIYFSTDMVYGLPQKLPVRTDHPQNPFGPYGQSKKDSEAICEEFRKRGMNITIFRPRMIVGPGRFGILTKLFTLMDKNLPVPMIGLGKNCYQMIAVDDCAKAVVQAIKKDFPNNAYNLGSKNPPMVKDLLRSVIQKSGSKSLLIPTWGSGVKAVLALLGSVGLEIMYREQYMIADQNYLLDISATERDLDWAPEHGDADMLAAAYDRYKTLGR